MPGRQQALNSSQLLLDRTPELVLQCQQNRTINLKSIQNSWWYSIFDASNRRLNNKEMNCKKAAAAEELLNFMFLIHNYRAFLKGHQLISDWNSHCDAQMLPLLSWKTRNPSINCSKKFYFHFMLATLYFCSVFEEMLGKSSLFI